MFVSIKWKFALVFVFILLITMTITNIIISTSISNYYIHQRKVTQMTTANIISTTISSFDDASVPRIRELIRQYIPRIDSRILYTDHGGRVLVDSSKGRRLDGHTLRHEEAILALSGETAYGVHNLPDSGWVMYVGVPVIINNEVTGIIFISSSINDIKQAVSYIRTLMLTISIISGIIVIFLSFLFANSLVRPIEKLTNVSERMSKGQLSSRVNINSNDEIGLLGNSFNSMAEQLEKIESNRLKFLGDISHDLKTPLATIKVLAESLEGEEDITTFQEFFGDIVSEVDRMTLMVNNILELNKITNANIPLKKSDFTYADIVKQCINSVSTLAKNKEIEIEFLDRSHGELFYADKEKIKSMTLNLIENAVKYTQRGGKIEICLKKEESFYNLVVRDNGKGIPEEDLPYIFDRFYRVDKTRHRDTGGSGIGLSIVKTVVDLHRGRVVVNSEIGVGSEFTISLPKLRF